MTKIKSKAENGREITWVVGAIVKCDSETHTEGTGGETVVSGNKRSFFGGYTPIKSRTTPVKITSYTTYDYWLRGQGESKEYQIYTGIKQIAKEGNVVAAAYEGDHDPSALPIYFSNYTTDMESYFDAAIQMSACKSIGRSGGLVDTMTMLKRYGVLGAVACIASFFQPIFTVALVLGMAAMFGNRLRISKELEQAKAEIRSAVEETVPDDDEITNST